jgi:ribosomal protein L21E
MNNDFLEIANQTLLADSKLRVGNLVQIVPNGKIHFNKRFIGCKGYITQKTDSGFVVELSDNSYILVPCYQLELC